MKISIHMFYCNLSIYVFSRFCNQVFGEHEFHYFLYVYIAVNEIKETYNRKRDRGRKDPVLICTEKKISMYFGSVRFSVF